VLKNTNADSKNATLRRVYSSQKGGFFVLLPDTVLAIASSLPDTKKEKTYII